MEPPWSSETPWNLTVRQRLEEGGRSRGRGEPGLLQCPCYEPIFSAQHSSLSCRGEGVEKKDKPPLAGLALPGMGRGGSGTVLSSLSLNSEPEVGR